MSGGVYLEKLTEFSALLRQEGLNVGIQETADAGLILSSLDLTDRETVRGALQAVYAKGREEQAVFRRAFDGFFVSVEQREALRRKHEAEAQELARRRAQAEQELQINGKPMELREDLREVYVRMGEQKQEELRQLLERSRGLLGRNPEKLTSNFVRSVFTRFLLEQQMALEDADLGAEAADPDLALLYRDISRFRETDIPRAAALIASISRRLDAELSRRKQGRGHSGKLSFRRTIRKGLETGGSFYRLSWKRKRRTRQRLVLLCDVSGSMLQFSEFALRFLKSMSEVSESSEVYLFSEETRRVDPFALQNMDAFRDYVRSSGLFGRGTDLGSALELPPRRAEQLHNADCPLRHQDRQHPPGRPGPAGGPAAGREGPLAEPDPRAEVALYTQCPDPVRAVPNGPVQHPGRAGQGVPEADEAGYIAPRLILTSAGPCSKIIVVNP